MLRSIVTENEHETETDMNADDYMTDTATSQPLSPVEIQNSSTELEIVKKQYNALQEKRDKIIDQIELEQSKVMVQNPLHDEMEQIYQIQLMTIKEEIDAMHIDQVEKQQQWLKAEAEL